MRFLTIILSLSILIIGMGCSGNVSDPATPDHDYNHIDLPVLHNSDDESSHNLLGKWTFILDDKNQTVEVIPYRDADKHHNVTNLLPPPDFEIISLDQLTGILEVDATITNPTALTAYDLRLIVYTDNYGIRLLNEDDWTPLFDIPGGMFVNPFIAYAKGEERRAFYGNGTQHTQRLQLYFPTGTMNINFAITASWPDNCTEPYQIKNFKYTPLHHLENCRSDIEVQVLDWQNDVNSVMLWCPPVTGVDLLPLTNTLADRWEAELVNTSQIAPGSYMGAIIATSENSGSTALYSLVNIDVQKAPILQGNSIVFGGNDFVSGYGIDVDNDGNIYVVGVFEGTVDFNPGAPVKMVTSNGNEDAFFCKFDKNWNLVWVNTWGGSGTDEAWDLVIDNSGYLYVSGGFSGTVDLNPDTGEDIHSTGSNNVQHAFVCKFDLDGNYLWGKSWGGNASIQRGRSMTLFDGGICISGRFSGTADFDPGDGEDIHSSNDGSYDAYISALDYDGNFLWARTWGGTSTDIAFGVDADNFGNIFVTGTYRRTCNFDTSGGTDTRSSSGNSYDVFLCKYDIYGDYKWVRVWGAGGQDVGYDCATDSSGNVYVTGHYAETVDFNPGDGSDTSSANGAGDIFLSKFNTDGDYLWGGRWGSNDQYQDHAFAVEVDNSDNAYVTGRFRRTVDFDPGDGEWIIQSQGGSDLYLSTFAPNGDLLWAKGWGGSGHERGYDIAFHDNAIYLTGYMQGTVNFFPGSGHDIWSSNGYLDAFVLRYTP